MEISTSINNNLKRQINSYLKKKRFSLIFIAETLRKHPVGGNLTRIAKKSYKVPNTNYTIPKGMRVYIPTYVNIYEIKATILFNLFTN